jgi:hypothetical protein
MRVRTIGKNEVLAAGRDHVVLAVSTDPVEGVKLCLLADDSGLVFPGWFPATIFELASAEVPPSWRIAVGRFGGRPDGIMLAPESWLEPSFFPDFWDDEQPEAQRRAREVFERELELIMRES